jgi:D-Tyr-tRNAtyr deacylase
MNKAAEQLADKIHTLDISQEEINKLVEEKAKELSVDSFTLYRQAQNAYYAKYQRGTSGVSPEACQSINVR